VPFGDAQDGDPLVLAELELGRADQVAHVLDEEQPSLGYVEMRKRVLDLAGVEVTGAAGLDLKIGPP
jgi:hypothetical protein